MLNDAWKLVGKLQFKAYKVTNNKKACIKAKANARQGTGHGDEQIAVLQLKKSIFYQVPFLENDDISNHLQGLRSKILFYF